MRCHLIRAVTLIALMFAGHADAQRFTIANLPLLIDQSGNLITDVSGNVLN